MADIAGGRAGVYDLLVGVFSHLPDEPFLDRVDSDRLKHFLDTCCDLNSANFKSGVNCIQAYQSHMKTRPVSKILEELSVDRTGILRGTGHRNLKPPYEGLYRENKHFGDTLLGIKRFYRKAGLMPEDSVSDPPDYICIELDFMRQLCLREQQQWAATGEAAETLAHEKTFLKDHLGCWVGGFCEQVEKHALTDFYRGFALILNAFIAMDMDFLAEFDCD